MSIVLQGSTSGSITLQEPAVAGSTVLDLPATSGTLITTGSSAAITQSMLATSVIPIGAGQTWQSVVGSRSIGTTYTNSTGRPITVIIAATGNGANGLFGVTINSAVTFYSPSAYAAGAWTSVSFIVPDGNTYQTTQQGSNVTLYYWMELR